MTKRKNRTESIFPRSGNLNADRALASLIVQRDLDLFWRGDDEPLMNNLHAITGKRELNAAETTYLFEVISSA